ncbi:carboxylesterase family protein [Vibrio hippocampi]|uniref:Carboxylic ester hydrolase n=1 Tax=Vibrio hippocampi TaxID=654686 RepID=A0ABN8DN99_9VIBR|nr:carboxylesterase family protein [Vibrio hippocampi]CAH0530371.1 Para-nitrobenzyl esterase [Vibrio hippocampi]
MKKVIILSALLVVLTGCNNDDKDTSIDSNFQATTTVTTEYGTIQGIDDLDGSVLSWLGVGYAKPPVGDLRWKAPQEPDEFHDVIETKQFRDVALQLAGSEVIGSEDSLYLNIWRPNSDEANLPVLLFVHGGGNVTGSAQEFIGNKLALQTNSVVISISYRLGALGWFRHPLLNSNSNSNNNSNELDQSGNFGLLDIIESLEWTNRNITYFGGDPENITLAGQSAGGTNVLAALISPLSQGLFEKLMVLSGGMTLSTVEQGNDRTIEAITKLVIENGEADSDEDALVWIEQHDDTLSYLKQQPAEKLPGLYNSASLSMDGTAYLFQDGVVVPETGYDVIESGDYNQVPVILGSDKHEYSMFALLSDPAVFTAFVTGTLFNSENSALLDSYLKASKYGSMVYSAYNAEKNARKLVSYDGQPPVYGFRFSWGEQPDVVKEPFNSLYFSARHGADMDFITGHFSEAVNASLGGALYFEENELGRENLSKAMMDYIGAFLHSGSPNNGNNPHWLSWGKQHEQLLNLDADLNQTVINMTSEVYSKDEVLSLMQSELSEDEMNNMIDIHFKNKNIWNLWE